jgi:CBS domain-containing protein
MKRRRIDHLPVVQERRLVGMITSKDIIEIMSRSERIGRRSLGIDETRARLDLAVTGIADKSVLTIITINYNRLIRYFICMLQNQTMYAK